MPSRISYAQNGEDVRLWHAFGPRESGDHGWVYVDVGANEPWHFSITAALSELGWRGLLIEADPELVERLRSERPCDLVVHAAAADRKGSLIFHRVPGTGLGTMDDAEAAAARARGFSVQDVQVDARRLDDILDENRAFLGSDIHAMTIDVEGAEAIVLQGLTSHRPWVMCIEAVEPGSSLPSHHEWEPALVARGYRFVAFDGINRWYVADEHADSPVPQGAGAPAGTTIAEAIATPMHVIDVGEHGWLTSEAVQLRDRDNRSFKRIAWQRELLASDIEQRVPRQEYERQINELRTALVRVEGSRTFRISRVMARPAKVVLRPFQRLLAAVARNPWVTRQRHLRHVQVNMQHLTNPGFLQQSADTTVDPSPLSEVPPGLDLHTFTEADAVRAWLEDNVRDSDEDLFARLDNRNDVVGRLRSALRTRLRIHNTHVSPAREQSGDRVLFDARSLQSPAFGTRGIGRFAAAALRATRAAVGDARITLICDPGLLPLPMDLADDCDQVPRVLAKDANAFAALISPSPMTHSPDPLLPVLTSGAYSFAIVFDFIPLDYPGVYLSNVADRAEYAACVDALKLYQEFACISQTVRDQLNTLLGTHETQKSSVVAWPSDITSVVGGQRNETRHGGTIVIASGDDARKNTFGGLAGVAAATVRDSERNVDVLGMAGHDDRVHHWSIAAAMRPGEAHTMGRISDIELTDRLASAELMVVPSFAEGLSLPVIEAVQQGTPVVASDIPAHRELIGTGAFLADPANPRSIARAVQRTRGKHRSARRQAKRLARHQHGDLETVIAERLLKKAPVAAAPSVTAGPGAPRQRLKIALATPWAPQKSGVADYSVAIGRALAELCELTVVTTSDARLDLTGDDRSIHTQWDIEELLADPDSADFDAIISVIGNSHFHLPFVELTSKRDCIVLAHDTRMIEFYLALRGVGGAQELMLKTADSDAPRTVTPALDDQIEDMRLLQNAGLWEVSRRARAFITHSPTSAERIEKQTSITPRVLTFAHYRPSPQHLLHDHQAREDREQARDQARARLGIESDGSVLQLATFGFVDVRTKQIDTVLEAAGWLTSWGYSVALTIVGSASDGVAQELRERAGSLNLSGFQITGYQSEERYQDWLLAVDLGVQLRVSPYLGVSGPLADMAAVGTPAVASAGLCRDVDAPAFIKRLPDVVSPVTLAEAIERQVASPMPWNEIEVLRREYVQSHSPERYAEQLMEVIREVIS